MELPKASSYPERKEQEKINFLDKNLQLDFSFEGDAVESLPVVSDDDLKTGMEKYCILMGSFENRAGIVDLKIKAVVEADQKEKPLYYEEGVGEVRPNIFNLKKLARSIKDNVAELSDSDFIGDVHTHPITKENQYSGDPCDLSPEDIEDIIAEYEDGNLSSGKPCIFGVAGRRIGEEETKYAFYRLVKDEGCYKLQRY